MRQVRIPSGFPAIPGRQMSFADEGPVLLISEESLANLNQRMKDRTGNEVHPVIAMVVVVVIVVVV